MVGAVILHPFFNSSSQNASIPEDTCILKLEVLNDDDKQAIISSLLPNYKHIYPILSAFCAGNTRVLTKLLVRAIRIAELNEVEVDEEVIKASVKQILV